MQAPSDQVLIEQTQKGDAQAFGRLVQRYQTLVYSLCYRMMGNPVDAEDVAQEAFLRVYRSLDRFRPGAPLRPWLQKVTANACLDALRKRKGPPLELDGLAEGASRPETPCEGEMPEPAFLNREVQLRVQKALLQLPGEYRAVLVLRYLEELSYQEIAEALGAPLSTVETRIHRAKKMLGRVLSPAAEGKEGARNDL